jgi:DNA-binding transcriptional LysR family regulator
LPLSLDLLRAFAGVADKGGFTAAARDLGVSKATVSKQVSELERDLGVTLFHRTTRRLSLTEAGARARARVARILDEAEALAEEAAATRDKPRGRLRIAAPLTFAISHLGPLLPEFLTAYPEIALDLSLDDRTVDLVGAGFDAALRIGPMPDSSLVARRLAPVRLLVAAAPAYWARHGRPDHPEDLAHHACFRYANTDDAAAWRFEDARGAVATVRVDGPLCVNNGNVELPSLCAGLGVARLPDALIWREIRAGRLEAVLPDWTGRAIALHLLTPPGRAAPRRLRVFSDFLATHFSAGRAPWLNAPPEGETLESDSRPD